MKNDLQGKKILIIGGINAIADLVELAHKRGIKVGVLDYNKNTYLKSIADYAYDMDALDVDGIVEIVREENYQGIISNFADSLMPYVNEVAQKTNLYTVFNEKQIKLSTDKMFFKQQCVKNGVLVPKQYDFSPDKIDEFSSTAFPVIVKPVDGSGSKGISVCRDVRELKEGYLLAVSQSRNRRVIVEQYLEGDEINLTYIAQDGDISLAAIHDRYFNAEQKSQIRVPDVYIYPSKYVDLFIDKYNDVVIRMLKNMGVKNGSLFMQAFVVGDQVYIYEAGMRLNGCKTYQILEVENKYNSLEHLMNYSLTGSMGEKVIFDPHFKRWYATLNVVGKPGAEKIRFNKIERLQSKEWIISIARSYFDGETIPQNSGGTLVQLVARIHLYADTKKVLLERIQETYDLLDVTDAYGENALCAQHSVYDLRKNLNYDLSYR